MATSSPSARRVSRNPAVRPIRYLDAAFREIQRQVDDLSQFTRTVRVWDAGEPHPKPQDYKNAKETQPQLLDTTMHMLDINVFGTWNPDGDDDKEQNPAHIYDSHTAHLVRMRRQLSFP